MYVGGCQRAPRLAVPVGSHLCCDPPRFDQRTHGSGDGLAVGAHAWWRNVTSLGHPLDSVAWSPAGSLQSLEGHPGRRLVHLLTLISEINAVHTWPVTHKDQPRLLRFSNEGIA